MSPIFAYAWLIFVFAVVGYNGWNVYRRPTKLSMWLYLGVSVGFSLAALVTYASAYWVWVGK